MLAVLGRNGAGKTTTMKALAGLLPVSGGRIEHDGVDVTDMAAEDRVRRGVVLVPEGRGVFALEGSAAELRASPDLIDTYPATEATPV